jgi:hypothetical protein
VITNKEGIKEGKNRNKYRKTTKEIGEKGKKRKLQMYLILIDMILTGIVTSDCALCH